MPTLAIPEDVAIPACGRCQSNYLDEESALAIQPRLQTAYLLALRIVRTRLAIDVLSQHISQRRLEQLLGLSPRASVADPRRRRQSQPQSWSATWRCSRKIEVTAFRNGTFWGASR